MSRKRHTLQEAQQTYERWWLGKRVRHVLNRGRFRLVTGVRAIGPPAGFTCIVELTFAGGGSILLGPRGNSFRPVKTDLEVKDEARRPAR